MATEIKQGDLDALARMLAEAEAKRGTLEAEVERLQSRIARAQDLIEYDTGDWPEIMRRIDCALVGEEE